MQSAKETASNIAASAKSGMEKTKATMQEKGEKMTTRVPLQKEMATEKKEQRINEAERQKQEIRQHNAATKQPTAGHGYSTGTGDFPPDRGVTEGGLNSQYHPTSTGTGTGRLNPDDPNVGSGVGTPSFIRVGLCYSV